MGVVSNGSCFRWVWFSYIVPFSTYLVCIGHNGLSSPTLSLRMSQIPCQDIAHQRANLVSKGQRAVRSRLRRGWWLMPCFVASIRRWAGGGQQRTVALWRRRLPMLPCWRSFQAALCKSSRSPEGVSRRRTLKIRPHTIDLPVHRPLSRSPLTKKGGALKPRLVPSLSLPGHHRPPLSSSHHRHSRLPDYQPPFRPAPTIHSRLPIHPNSHLFPASIRSRLRHLFHRPSSTRS